METSNDDHHHRDRPADRRDARPVRRAGRRSTTARTGSSTRTSRSCAQSGYLLAAVPTEFGGAGLGLDEYRQAAAPARLRRPGDRAGRQHALLLDRRRRRPAAARATRRAAGCSRRPPRARSSPRSTARPATTSRCCCRRPRPSGSTGGWEITGHKIFGSLSPVWTLRRLPRDGHLRPGRTRRSSTASCHATPTGYEIVETWDTLGMRATQSQDTVLDKAFVPDETSCWCARPGSPAPACSRSAIFAWALHGLRRRCTSAPPSGPSTSRSSSMPKRTSIALTRSMAHHPEVQHNVAEMRIALDAAEALLERHHRLGDRRRRTPTGRCASSAPATSSSTRPTTSSTGRSTCRAARRSFKRNRLEQLFRDVRMGRFHPGNTLLAHELIGKLCLGHRTPTTRSAGVSQQRSEHGTG